MKNVQIPYDLFLALLRYHLTGDQQDEAAIRAGLDQKLEAMVMRDLYSKSKTSATPAEREAARKAYLDRRGVPDSFRWDSFSV